MTTRAVHDLFRELPRDIRALVGPSTKVLMHADPREANQPAATSEAT